MKLVPIIVTGICLAGTANAGDTGSPNAPAYPAYGRFQPPPRVERPPQRGFHIERGANEQGYYLLIHADGLDPKAIQVTPMGRSLLISVTQSHQSGHRYTPPQARPGYTQWDYSAYRSSGTMQRRISVPRDADLDAMRRTDSEAMISITLPRLRRDLPPGQHD